MVLGPEPQSPWNINETREETLLPNRKRLAAREVDSVRRELDRMGSDDGAPEGMRLPEGRTRRGEGRPTGKGQAQPQVAIRGISPEVQARWFPWV